MEFSSTGKDSAIILFLNVASEDFASYFTKENKSKDLFVLTLNLP